MTWKTSQKLAAIGGGMLIAANYLNFIGGVFKVLPPLTGAALLLTIPSKGNREEDDDLTAYCKNAWPAWWAGVKTEAKEFTAEVLPIPLRPYMESALESIEDPMLLFKALHQKSFCVIGSTGDGKTFVLHQSFKLSQQLGESVAILDKTYGKRADDRTDPGFGRWYDAPLAPDGIVYPLTKNTVRYLPNLWNTFYKERERRIQQEIDSAKAGKACPKFQKQILYMTELNETARDYVRWKTELKDPTLPDLEHIQGLLQSVLMDGHGHELFVRLDAQTAASGITDLSEAERAQLNWFLVGSAAINSKELMKFGLSPKEWIPKVETARRLPGRERTGIVILSGKPHLLQCPFIEEKPIFKQDPMAEWTNHIRDILQSQKQAGELGKSPSAHWPNVKDHFPTGHKQKSGPYWNVYYEIFEKITGE
jgi:hypothetical protein